VMYLLKADRIVCRSCQLRQWRITCQCWTFAWGWNMQLSASSAAYAAVWLHKPHSSKLGHLRIFSPLLQFHRNARLRILAQLRPVSPSSEIPASHIPSTASMTRSFARMVRIYLFSVWPRQRLYGEAARDACKAIEPCHVRLDSAVRTHTSVGWYSQNSPVLEVHLHRNMQSG